MRLLGEVEIVRALVVLDERLGGFAAVFSVLVMALAAADVKVTPTPAGKV